MRESRQYLTTQLKTFSIPVGLFLVLLLGITDYLTGPEFGFSIFYLLPISGVTWYTGRRAGVVVAVASAVTWLAADLMLDMPVSHAAIPYWNAGMRLGLFLIIVFLMWAWKDLNNHLEERVVERTSALTEEITERKRAEQALRRRDAILQAVSFASQEFLRTTDLEQSIHEVLQRLGQAAQVSRVYIFEKHDGSKGEALVSQRYEWVAPGIVAELNNLDLQSFPMKSVGFERWETMFVTGEPIYGHVRNFPPGEQAVLVPQDIKSMAVVPIFVEGECWGFIGFDQCVREREWSELEIDALEAGAGIFGSVLKRRRVEEALEESEDRYRAVVEQTIEGIFVADPETKQVLQANAAFQVMLGYTADEISRLTVYDFIAHDRADIDQRIETILKKRRSFTDERVYRRKDGSLVDVSVSASALTYGRKDTICAVVRDITDRKQAEEKLRESEKEYRELVDNALVGVYKTRLDGQVLYANNALVRIFEFDSVEEAISEGVVRRYKNARDRQHLIEKLKETGKVESFEADGLTKTGRVKRLLLSASLEGDVVSGMVIDVTERRRAEEALEKERTLLRTLIEAIPDEVVLKDRDSKFLLANEAACRALKATEPDQVIGRTDFNFMRRELAEKHRRDEESIIKTEMQLLNREQTRVNPTTGLVEKCVLETKVPARDRRGNIVGLLCINRNITELKRTEDTLRSSEERYRTLAEAAHDAIFIIGRDDCIQYVNSYAANLVGKNSSEIVGKPRQALFPAGVTGQQRLQLEKVYESGRPVYTEAIVPFQSGLIALGTWLVPLRDKSGKITAVMGISRDITERQQAQQELADERNLLRTLIDNLPDYIFVKDNERRFVLTNAAVANLWGVKGPQMLTGKTDFDFFPKELAAKYRADEEEVLNSGQSLINKEQPLIDSSGQKRWISTTKVPLRDNRGKIVGLVGMNRDVTERRMLEEQLLHAQKMEGLGTLAGGIAHDFNNILGIILGHASLLERGKVDPARMSKSTGAINKAVQRGSHLVRQLLTFARKTEALTESVRMNSVISELVNLVKDTAPKTVQVTLQLDKDLPSIIGDPNQIHQALLNLVVNALDAMPKKGTLTFKTQEISGADLAGKFPDAEGRSYVCVSVADTGVGMDQATRTRIFEPFFTTKEKGKGTGLGLAVVYGIVKSHHGFTDVESEVGQGTTFHLYFPIQSYRFGSSRIEQPEQEEIAGGTETILVVEDEKLLVDLLRNVLEGKGYRVLTARDGLRAVRVYKDRSKDIALVFMDMGLPRLGGSETLERLREINPKVRTILASGYVDPHLKSELLKAGAKHFVQKPYVPDEVLRRVREVLDRGES